MENLLFDKVYLKNIEKDIKRYFAKTGLSKRFNNFSIKKNMNLTIDNFSGGEKKRIALIRSWLRNCPIEILDEPTESLDLINVNRISDLIKDRSKNKIIIIATHEKLLIDNATKLISMDNNKANHIGDLYENL